MPLKTQRQEWGGGVHRNEVVEEGGGCWDLKKLFICCHAWKILLGANGEYKAVKSKDGITKANALRDIFQIFFPCDSTVDLQLYNELFLNTVNGVPYAVNTHLLKAGGLGFRGA